MQIRPNEDFVITAKKMSLNTVDIVPYHMVFVRLNAVPRSCFLVAIMTPEAKPSDNTASNIWHRRIKVIIYNHFSSQPRIIKALYCPVRPEITNNNRGN